MNIKEYQHDYQQRNKEELKDKRKIWRRNNPELRRAQAERYAQKVKREVLTYYGGNSQYPVCIHCGEMRLACLSIDPIRGNGAEHRKVLRGTRIYVWLRTSNYPPGYQTLCMNCQWVKRVEKREYA